MEKITFINSRGKRIVLGDAAPYVLTSIEGLGAVNTNIQTQKSPNQDGESYLGNTLSARSLSIEVMIITETKDEMIQSRSNALKVFNPKLGPGTLVYTNGNKERRISAISEMAPVFPDAGDFKDSMQPGLIQLYCPSPFWLDPAETSEEIVTWIGGIKFPLVLPTKFATKGPKKINIINQGDSETPVRIEFFGPATNPKIINHTTGEHIQVNRTLSPDDVLVITTDFGRKRVEINGQNVFNWIDLSSTFWQLQPGDNIVEYTSDDEVEPAAVKISYYNRYVGV